MCPRCFTWTTRLFHSRALRTGCDQYGIELEYRPVGKPYFGGHIERMNRTLMQRLKGLPGAMSNSPKVRKARKSDAPVAHVEDSRAVGLDGAEVHRQSPLGNPVGAQVGAFRPTAGVGRFMFSWPACGAP